MTATTSATATRSQHPPCTDITSTLSTTPNLDSTPYIPSPNSTRPRDHPRLLPPPPPVCEQTERYRDKRLAILRSKPGAESVDIGRARHLRRGDVWDGELGRWIEDLEFVAEVVALPVKVGVRGRFGRALARMVWGVRVGAKSKMDASVKVCNWLDALEEGGVGEV